jgi:6-pyruvoyltetrahydropterin/6-carboxytetrahydropterin synthase
MDFGGLKPFKDWLKENFDHRTLVAKDDPMMARFRELDRDGVISLNVVDATGCEGFGRMCFIELSNVLAQYGHSPRVRLEHVEVREHAANSALVTFKGEW